MVWLDVDISQIASRVRGGGRRGSGAITLHITALPDTWLREKGEKDGGGGGVALSHLVFGNLVAE
jgi:hypothetical protein